ncbi:MAG: HD-GYP domain-containing protein [Bacillota bacterium]|nr:HD-GYP domain-containing protein [Bacillota bacterium]
MRKIRIEELLSGMQVARSIYSGNGRVLLNAGVELTDTIILRLITIGIPSVYIMDPISDTYDEPKQVVSEEVRLETIKTVKETFNSLEQERKINTHLVNHVVSNLIDEILSNQQVLMGLTDIRSYDDYTFGHSVNVCILSLMTALSLQYHDLKLKELGIGALLHDIGKIAISTDILNKADDLSQEEYEEIKKHAAYGYDILRKYEDIPLLSAHIALQHHERFDGKGYPRNLEGDNIHEYAKIVAVADVYDALLADRPYRSCYTVNQAITILKRMSGIHLDERCTTALISNIAIYPIGTIVELNTGTIGIVSDVNRDFPTRPNVRIIYDKTTRKLCHSHEVNLANMSTVMITRSLTEMDITSILK